MLAGIFATGCGGSSGGGGGNTSPGPTSGITGVQVGGTAAKGIIINGDVVANELDSNGGVIAQVGSTTTDNTGKYSLKLNDNYQGGPIEIKISKNINTTMKCDVPAGCGNRIDGLTDNSNPGQIDFGEEYKPASLMLTALVPEAEANATISASVTPFSHAAAARAKAAATLDAAAVANANSEVSNLLGGIDILNTEVVDISDPSVVYGGNTQPAQLTLAALASSLANQGLTDSNGQPDLDASLSQLTAALQDGAITADDTGDANDANEISLQEIVSGASQTFTFIGINDVTGVLDELQDDITTAEAGNGIIDPEPSPGVTDPTLEKVKAFLADLRTWGTVIKNETQTQGTAFDMQVQLASDALSAFSTANIFDALSATTTAALEYDGVSTDLGSYTFGPFGSIVFDGGTIASSTPGVVTITNGSIYGYSVNATIGLPADGSTGTSFSIDLNNISISGTDSDVTISNSSVLVELANDYTVDYAAIDTGTAPVLPPVTNLVFDLDTSLTQKQDQFGASLTSPVTFSGSLDFDLDVISVTNVTEDNFLPKTLSLNGAISDTQGNSFDAALVANITNTATLQLTGPMFMEGSTYSANNGGDLIAQWSYSDTDSTPGNDTFTFQSINQYNNESYYWNAVDGSSTLTYDNYIGTYNSITEYAQFSVFIYDDYVTVPGQGTYYFSSAGADTSIDGMIDGVLEFSEDPIQFPIGTLYSDNNLPIYYWSYSDTDSTPGNDTFTLYTQYNQESYYWNSADNSVSSTSGFTLIGPYGSLQDVLNSELFPYDIYTYVNNQGWYFASIAGADFTVDGSLDGVLIDADSKITETDTANGWIDADIGLTFSTQLSGLPAASININADRSGFSAGDGAVTISYGTRQLMLSSAITDNAINGSLTITNQDNIVLTIDPIDRTSTAPSLLTGKLTFNGIEYGSIKETSGGWLKISYPDGSFEVF